AKCTIAEATEAFKALRIRLYDDATASGIRCGETTSTDVGKTTQHWRVVPLGEAAVIENRLRKPLSATVRSRMPGPYPYFGPTGILDTIDEYRLEGQYVLIGEDGDHFLKWASWSMTQLVDGRFNVNNHAHVIRGG